MHDLIDSHAHLTYDRFDADRAAVLDRATAAGVVAILTIGTDLASSQAALALAESDPRLFASAGIHPHEADALDDADWPTLAALWQQPRVRAVGECGLDYFYDHSDRGRQRVVFRRHLEAAGEVELPVVIHIRDAFDDAYADIRSVGLPAGGVVHCFTGGPAECEAALAMGLHVSISGIATFKNATALREAVAMIPADRLLVETDSPFLAPTPHRGKRNEPAFVVQTAREVAKLRGEDFATVCAVSRVNAIRLFRLPLA